MAVAIFCIAIVVICIPLVIFKPQAVFYIFIASTVFGAIFYGYIFDANNLGLPRAWQPSDFLWILVFFAAFFVKPEITRYPDTIKKCIAVVSVLLLVSIVQGLIRNPVHSITFMRIIYCTTAAFFASRYLTTAKRVQFFVHFVILLTILMFVVHVLIRYAIYTPPTARIDYETKLGGERGGSSLALVLYLLLLGIGTGRLSYKKASKLYSVVMLLVGLMGIFLSESRSLYGGLAVLVMGSVLFVKNKIKLVAAYAVVGIFGVFVAGLCGYNFLERFEYGQAQETSVTEAFEHHTWRGMEYQEIARQYAREPYFFLTGRGIGALHAVPWNEVPYAAFWHSEYLNWLDRVGLIGFGAFIIMLMSALWNSYFMCRKKKPFLVFLGTSSFLAFSSLFANGVFHPIIMNDRIGPLLICFFVIIANRRSIAESMEEEEYDSGQLLYYEEALM